MERKKTYLSYLDFLKIYLRQIRANRKNNQNSAFGVRFFFIHKFLTKIYQLRKQYYSKKKNK